MVLSHWLESYLRGAREDAFDTWAVRSGLAYGPSIASSTCIYELGFGFFLVPVNRIVVPSLAQHFTEGQLFTRRAKRHSMTPMPTDVNIWSGKSQELLWLS
jgi:hypothetical protein